jgi:hypothetical protein
MSHRNPPIHPSIHPSIRARMPGVDVSATDSLGKLALTDGGIGERDRAVMRACAEAGVPVS